MARCRSRRLHDEDGRCADEYGVVVAYGAAGGVGLAALCACRGSPLFGECGAA